MQEWQQRVVDELTELVDKIIKLDSFIESEAYKKLDVQNQILIDRQKFSMLDYYDILDQRIALFNFDGKPSIELQNKIGNM